MKHILHMLKSYVEGKLSYRRGRAVKKWLDSEKGKKVFSDWVNLSYLEEGAEEVHPDWQGDDLLRQILEKKNFKDRSIRKYRRVLSNAWTYRIVASFLFLVILGSVWYDQHLSSKNDESDAESVPILVTNQNPKGQKSRIILPDSSIVYLNADSKLSYWQNFEEGRKVTLVGEAFFEVKSDSLNSFVVLSPRLSSTAVGTSFTVSAYPDQPSETVALATGKIVVANSLATQSVVLRPGEGTFLKENSEEFTKISIDTDIYSLWTKGILHFDKVPWSQVIVLLERWYGVTIDISGAWSDPLCSGSFEQNEYLNNVLKVLGHSIGFSYSINGKNVKIHLKP